jgi:hypothetical protein
MRPSEQRRAIRVAVQGIATIRIGWLLAPVATGLSAYACYVLLGEPNHGVEMWVPWAIVRVSEVLFVLGCVAVPVIVLARWLWREWAGW